MAGLRGFSPFFKRIPLLLLLLMTGLILIAIYYLKTTALEKLFTADHLVSEVSSIINNAKNRNTEESIDDYQESMNILSQQPIYKGLHNLMVKQVRVNLQQRFKDVPLDKLFQPGHKVPIKDVRRVLIISSFRSGSSFLGELLQSYQGVFYSFEPLHLYVNSDIHLEKGKHVQEALTLIRNILICNLTSQIDYLMYIRKNEYMMRYNRNYWQSCSLNPAFCFDPNFISDVCQYMPINVIKTVRLGLDPVQLLLNQEHLNLKIIHLVRDPRGSLNSRMKMYWCKNNPCSDPETICGNLLYDLNISKHFIKKYPDRYLLVRYEDLSTNTEKMARDIFSFLGLTFYDSIQKFIETHTSGNYSFTEVNPFAIYRDSKKTVFAWRDSLSYDAVEHIQKHCQEPLQMLGLRCFTTHDQYKNKTLSVIKSPLLL